MSAKNPGLDNALSHTRTDVRVYLHRIAVSVERLGFHRNIGKRNRLFDPVVGLIPSPTPLRQCICRSNKRTTYLNRTQIGHGNVHRPCPHNEDRSCRRNLNVRDIRLGARPIVAHPLVGCSIHPDLSRPPHDRCRPLHPPFWAKPLSALNRTLTRKVQNCGHAFVSALDPVKLSYHVLRYGVLTARGHAVGKSVCTGPCAETRDEKSGINKKDHSVEGSIAGKRARNPGRPRVRLEGRLTKRRMTCRRGSGATGRRWGGCGEMERWLRSQFGKANSLPAPI